MNCKCEEKGHGHNGFCDIEIKFKESLPMSEYREEKQYGKDDKGEKIVIGLEYIDFEKERCCNNCYEKIKNKAIFGIKNKELEEDDSLDWMLKKG